MTNPDQSFPKNAFVILNGADIITLDKNVINIGRMDDNDIVIPNAHISRYHAQLRGIDGNFVLVDLESTSGTMVNGNKIDQKVMAPGDVILMAGVPLIYGQTSGADKITSRGKDPSKKTTKPTARSGITQEVDLSTVDSILDIIDISEDEPKPPKENREH